MSEFLANFRVWDNKKEVYVQAQFYLSYNNILCHYDTVLHTIIPVTDDEEYMIEHRTASKDIDGTYIYEHDIIERNMRLHVVKWVPHRNAFLCFDENIKDTSFLGGNCSIRGNIHEGYIWVRGFKNYYCELKDLNPALTEPPEPWVTVGNKIHFKRERYYGVIEKIHGRIVYVRVFDKIKRYTFNFIHTRTVPCLD